MKRNNKGFIAISLIYSFFLVFLVTLLTTINEYVHNRLLLNSVKKETQEFLNEHMNFYSFTLENREYQEWEIVSFGYESWRVLKNEEDVVTLILNRNLDKQELTSILGDTKLIIEDKILMCSNGNSSYCGSKGAGLHNPYNWKNSIAKTTVDGWFNKNNFLKKTESLEFLQEMDFVYLKTVNEEKKYQDIIRIPTLEEYDTILQKYNVSDIWHLTGEGYPLPKFSFEEEKVSPNNAHRKIRPVIMVKKDLST